MPVRRLIAAASVLLALPALGHAAGADGWHGRTSQGKPMDLDLTRSGGLVRLVQARYVLTCEDGAVQTRTFALGTRTGDTVTVDEDGRFASSAALPGGLPDEGTGTLTYRIRGRVTATRASGTFRVDFTLDNGSSCTSDRVGWTLR